MSPSIDNTNGTKPVEKSTFLKPTIKDPIDQYQNFFQSTGLGQAARDAGYEFSDLLPTFPLVNFGPAPIYDNIVDKGFNAKKTGGWQKGELLSRPGVELVEINPVIGLEIKGVDLRTLTDHEKDELALMAAERGVVIFHDQPDFDIHEQTSFVEYFGPLHKHASSGTPADPSLAHVHVVYKDAGKRAPPGAFTKTELWHTDVSYEKQPPGLSSFKVITNPPTGGDTLFASAYGLYDACSPGLRAHLETLSALHSGLAQGNKEQLRHQRRPPIETVHPVVRVHPVTGWKSIYVDPASTRYILDLPKAESEMYLNFLWHQVATDIDLHARVKWRRNSVGFWDNRSVIHAGTFDFWPHCRHAVRVMAIAETPASVEDAEKRWGIQATSCAEDTFKARGWDVLLEKIA